MTSAPRILVVENRPALKEAIGLLLEENGMEVTAESHGQLALDRFGTGFFDGVVLDLTLPGISGFTLCAEIRRASQVPVLIVTARRDLSDVVRGLELGADDYLTTPFRGPELVARIRAVLRRVAPQDGETLSIGDIEIDSKAFRLYQRGEEVHLSRTEFRLAVELARHAGEVLSRHRILQRVWNTEYLGESRLIDMAVARLRQKLECGQSGVRITTVRGAGYRLDGPAGGESLVMTRRTMGAVS